MFNPLPGSQSSPVRMFSSLLVSCLAAVMTITFVVVG